jgi:putative colanic acid biosynthesis acetyltransferase WcaF
MILSHSSTSSDAYKRASFSTSDKIRRLIWQITWFLLCRWSPKPIHSWRVIILRFFGAKIGKSNFIYPSCKIWAPWLLETEDVVTIGPGVEIYNPGGVFIGHHAIVSQDAYLCGATHDYNTIEFTYLKSPIKLESYSWVCAKAIVLPGVVLKEGSVLGAAGLTSKNLNAWSIYGGNPAKFIKFRVNFLNS